MKAPRPKRSRTTGKPEKTIRLHDRVRELARSLAAIDRDEEVGIYPGAASDEATANRRAAIAALSEIQDFLHSQRIYSAVLWQLRSDLKAVEFPGENPAMFTPPRMAGRKADSKVVKGLKGRFAGMAHLKMQCGLSRQQAASWVARSIPSGLASRVTTKPISPSTVKEWMERYGGNARIRRQIKSAGLPDDYWTFFKQEIQSKHIEGNYGELECLRMIGLGHECLAAGESIPFQQIFDLLEQEYFLEIFADLKP